MANPIEFGSFMLLPLFFTQVLYPTECKKYWGLIRFAYISSIVGMIVFQALWIILTALEMQEQSLCDPSKQPLPPPPSGPDDTGQHCFHTEFSSDAFRAITAFCFLFLAATQGARERERPRARASVWIRPAGTAA